MHTVAAHQSQSGETHIVYAVFTMHHGGDGQRSTAAIKDAFADVANGDGHCIERCTLIFDNLCTGLLYEIFHSLVVAIPANPLGICHMVFVIIDLEERSERSLKLYSALLSSKMTVRV